jgi:hypothetical protein
MLLPWAWSCHWKMLVSLRFFGNVLPYSITHPWLQA